MSSTATESSAPRVEEDSVTFYLPDKDLALLEVQLIQELQRPRVGPHFQRNENRVWELRIARPDADRMEYKFYLLHDDGGEEAINDPANPLTAPGPFGAKSVIEFPGYRPPAWVDAPDVDPSSIAEMPVTSRTLRAQIRVQLWTAPGHAPDEPLPLLIANDGPEYNELSDLLRFLNHKVETALPPMRVALVAPVDRDQIYSASAAYARAFSYEILPAIERVAPAPHGRSMRVGMGASLGGLTMLYIHRVNPATFGALFLQSGSYFRQRFDKQEADFVRFGRISRFMGRVLTAHEWAHPIPVAMTCGLAEENLANNRATAAALRRQGYDVHLFENRDAHNWIGWRDSLDPHLSDLLAKAWTT
ncbi:MAG: alpha/beta hydrolase [Actinomycetota bacterium]